MELIKIGITYITVIETQEIESSKLIALWLLTGLIDGTLIFQNCIFIAFLLNLREQSALVTSESKAVIIIIIHMRTLA